MTGLIITCFVLSAALLVEIIAFGIIIIKKEGRLKRKPKERKWNG